MRGPVQGPALVFRAGCLPVPHSAEALAAVYGSTIARLKRYFALATTLCTYSGKHLPRLVAFGIGSLGSAVAAARRAPLGVVRIALGGEELLLFDSEDELGAAVCTLQRLVNKSHWMTSFP